MKIRALFSVVVLTTLVSATAIADEFITDPAPNSPESVVMMALEAGLADDFKAYLEVVHPEHRATPKQINERRNYEWARFREQAFWYWVSEPSAGYFLVRRKPEGEFSLRVFVQDQIHQGRMPTPVWLKRDGDTWGIVVNSL